MHELWQTLGDDMERVTWRSKQALDFSFLMMYAKDRGTFYVQLEDDVLQEGIHHHEEVCPEQDCGEEAMVCDRLLCHLGFYWKDGFKSVEATAVA